MAKKVIQVPINDGLLQELDSLSRKRRKSRSELIREACQCYLQQVMEAELDEIYQQGYEKVPEELEIGEAQVALTTQITPKESW